MYTKCTQNVQSNPRLQYFCAILPLKSQIQTDNVHKNMKSQHLIMNLRFYKNQHSYLLSFSKKRRLNLTLDQTVSVDIRIRLHPRFERLAISADSDSNVNTLIANSITNPSFLYVQMKSQILFLNLRFNHESKDLLSNPRI